MKTNFNEYLWYVRKHKKTDKAAYTYLAAIFSKQISITMLMKKLSNELDDGKGSKGKTKI